jgi:hypothetical protein
MNTKGNFDHPAFANLGWWEEESRFIFGIREVEESLDREVPSMKPDCIER